MTGPTFTVDDEPWDAPDGTALRAAQRAELDARYGSDDHENGTAPTAEGIAVFVVARDGEGRALGCGALRRLSDISAEIKRMYVVPEARGTGVATAILRTLETRALARGWTTLGLETGPGQPDAVRFYEREGYRETEPFGEYADEPGVLCYQRSLTEPSVEETASPISGVTASGLTRAGLAFLPLLVSAFAASAALLAGVATFAVLDATGDEEGFGELDYVFAAILMAAGLYLAVMTAGLAVAARRQFLAGHRIAPVALASLAVAETFGLFLLISFAYKDLPPTPITALLVLAFVLAPSTVFSWAGGRHRWVAA